MKLDRIRAWIGENRIRAALAILAALLLLILLLGLLLVNVGIGRLGYEADDTEPVTIDPAYAAGNGIRFPDIEPIQSPGSSTYCFLAPTLRSGKTAHAGGRTATCSAL